MSLSEIVSYDKEGGIDKFPWLKKVFVPLIIILVSGLSFGIGRLSVGDSREPIRIEYDPQLTTNNSQPTNDKQTVNSKIENKSQTASVIQAANGVSSVGSGEVVVSKNGTKYHFLHCGGAKQIKEENKITFPTPAAAEAAGYTLAANCKPK